MPNQVEQSPVPWDYISKLVLIGDSATGKSSLTIRLCEGRFINTHDVTIGVEFGSRIVPVGPPASALLQSNNSSSLSSPLPLPSSLSPSLSPSPANGATSGSTSSGTKGHGQKGRSQQRQRHMKVSLWDTAGQETYKSITRSYFRGASGALLVFDISRRSTFESTTGWLNDLRQIAEEEIVVILVGNKTDLADKSTGGENKRAVTKEEAEEWCKREGVMRYVETSAKSGEGVERAFLEVAERIYQNIEAGKYDLNDRRSGVKSYGTGGGREGGTAQQTVTLAMNDAMKSGPCC